MWGQAFSVFRGRCGNRIIPTRVGTSRKEQANAVEDEDHPHACGDKLREYSRETHRRGSSPRVWGQVAKAAKVAAAAGIIPTRVGTRPVSFSASDSKRDHPHACGDKGQDTVKSPLGMGSSPRVWGQVQIVNNRLILVRIIPTRVGTSFAPKKEECGVMDHPHACGDKRSLTAEIIPQNGSSPRVWGQVLTDGEGNAKMRIIPTRVGTSKSKTGGTA